MRDAGDEAAHVGVGVADALCHRRERLGEVANLVAPLDRDVDVEGAFGHALRCDGELLERSRDVARDDDSEHDGGGDGNEGRDAQAR